MRAEIFEFIRVQVPIFNTPSQKSHRPGGTLRRILVEGLLNQCVEDPFRRMAIPKRRNLVTVRS